MTALLPPPGAGSCALPGQAALRTIIAALSGPAGSADIVRVSTVVFNRPYLMLVTDTATGEPLFLANVADPTAD